MPTPTELLGPDGPLARHIEGFAPRQQQQAMAESVAEAIAEYEILITEAGTGTGKTYAYLVPALLSGKKIIVSTGTKTLQDQLFHRDLPVVREALGLPVSVALLKGRANYLCLHRLELNELEGRFHSRDQVAELSRVRAWSGLTRSGDITELTDIPEDSPIWPQVTSTADNCLGQDCAFFTDCHVLQARRAAQQADVLVINHHLLFADMALREEGFGELLPGANAIILDEAHQLPDIASQFFGMSLSSRQLLELAHDTTTEQIKEAGDMKQLAVTAERLEKAARDMRLALGQNSRRAAWTEVAADSSVNTALAYLKEQLDALCGMLETAAVRGKGLENCWKRAMDLSGRLESLSNAAPDNHIHWFETYTRAFTLNLTPIDIGDSFQRQIKGKKCAWIFTSATLTVADSFQHFMGRMGLYNGHTAEESTDDTASCHPGIVTQRWDSPFDFARLALFYVPPDMPDPADQLYNRAVIQAALPVIEASRGRAFLLFTSHRALQEAADLLEGKIDYPLLVQGTMARRELLERFRELGNAVLLGTSSFWEGVDVRGAALSCVIIDKLPFASPGDPILQARIEALRQRGANPFVDFQLPHAVITLKQGVGRLIRDVTDRGVLMVCDPRLLSKSYGRIFIESLPRMSRTQKIANVQRFFAQEAAQGMVEAL